MGNEQDRVALGAGFGIGVILGLLIGAVLVVRLGNEAAETVKTVADRVVRRREGVRFEAMLQ